MNIETKGIIDLKFDEVEMISGGTAAPAVAGRVFYWVGVVTAIEWAGDKAYKAGKAFGRM